MGRNYRNAEHEQKCIELKTTTDLTNRQISELTGINYNQVCYYVKFVCKPKERMK